MLKTDKLNREAKMASAPNIGDRVKVDCEEGWYKGEVVKLRSRGKETVRVKFDDGDMLWVSTEVVRVIKKAHKVAVEQVAPVSVDRPKSKPASASGKFTSVQDALGFINSLDPESYLYLLASTQQLKSKSIKNGSILRVAFPDGTVGYGLPVGGGQTLKIWRIGNRRYSYYAVAWNCVVPTGESVSTGRGGWPSEADEARLNAKYGK